MDKNNIYIKFKSEKGSVTAFVIMVSILLSIVGLSILSLSVSSGMTAGKIKSANQKYLIIDKGQETLLSSNDGILALAYSYAYTYVQNDFYETNNPPDKIESQTPSIDQNTQLFFYNNYENWQGDLNDYRSGAVDILYFYFIDKMINAENSTITIQDNDNNNIELNYVQTIDKDGYYNTIYPDSNWENSIPSDGDIIINVEMTDEEYTIDASVYIKKPVFENHNGQNILVRYDIRKWVFSSN